VSCAVFAFPECAEQAARLAGELGVECIPVSVHHFPDGESLVRAPAVADTVLLYRSLDRPNQKVFELLLAAAALRDRGAGRLILVIPYLAYMRQDTAFQTGEAVSQRVLGGLLSAHCDAVITVDPHLHRISSLAEVMPGIEAVSVSAAPALADALKGIRADLLVGPDGESRQWVAAVASAAGIPYILGEKRRRADREVELTIPQPDRAAGRHVVLVDDLISSGSTLLAAARLLEDAGAQSVSAIATHCLASHEDLKALRAEGISAIRSTQTVPGPTACIDISAVLAREIRRRGWCPANA
jgi:ribose-phosphate pyrophosphokinase